MRKKAHPERRNFLGLRGQHNRDVSLKEDDGVNSYFIRYTSAALPCLLVF